MPGLLGFVAYILGSGTVAGVIVAIANHRLQQRRDREQETREAQRAEIARQRQVCLDLLTAVHGFHSWLFTFRRLHDNLESRLSAKDMLAAPRQQMQSLHETVLRVRSELDLQPNDKLQRAIDGWGDAGTAYEQALERPMSSRFNPVRLYLGKTPQDEINRLADNYGVRFEELRAAVREYVAGLEASAAPPRKLRLPKLPTPHGLTTPPKLPALPLPHFHRQDGADAQDRAVVGVTAETPVQHAEQGEPGPETPQ